jgi:hypothetical protein
MKQLFALLVAVALFSPAFAQKTTPQFTRAKSNLHIVAPASKPLLLHAGRPLTPNDKSQFLAAVIRTAPAGTKKTQMSSARPSTVMLTAGQVSQGNAYLVMENPGYVDIPNSEILFNVGDKSNITFIISAQPNTAYLFAIKVNADRTNPQFTVYTGDPYLSTLAVNSETFSGVQGDNEFAYGVVSNSAGYIAVTIDSPNSQWYFTNCEITSSTF